VCDIARVGGWIDFEEMTVTSGTERSERDASRATASPVGVTADPTRRTALARVVDALACPVCGEALALTEGGTALACGGGHGFDIAKQGYVSLLRGGGNASTGDNADMVAARDALLGRGHYERIADAVASAVAGSGSGDLVVDLAGGTGYYLERVLRAHPELRGIDIDLSKFAARRAARRIELEWSRSSSSLSSTPSSLSSPPSSPASLPAPTLAAVVADVWQPLPLRTHAVSVILSIFGPRNRPEILRVLRPGGQLVVVTPTARHLRELVGPLGMIGVDDRKHERLAAQLDGFVDLTSTAVEYETVMSHADVVNDVLMGPSAHHVDADVLAARVAQLPDPVNVTVSVTVTTAFAPTGSRER
jgi:23S rRNA (guanine745-N1)-methyltransferase